MSSPEESKTKTKRLRVIHVLGPLRPSGMERMLVAAAPYFAEKAESIVIGQGPENPFASELQSNGYDVRIVPPIRSARGMLALSSLFRMSAPDVVHIHSESAFLFSVLCSRLWAPRARIVRTVHSIFLPRGWAYFSRTLQALLADRLVDRFIAPSPEVATNELRWNRSCRTIFNWVSDSFYSVQDRQQEMNLALLVGNCSSVKNHELALRALTKTNLKIAHVGSERGASTQEQALLDQLDNSGRLVHRGAADPLPFLLRASVYLLPSRAEGMGVSLAEALCVGVSSIVADVVGLRWAKGLPGVRHIPNNEENWIEALTESSNERATSHLPVPDFRAERGTREYLKVYEGGKCE